MEKSLFVMSIDYVAEGKKENWRSRKKRVFPSFGGEACLTRSFSIFSTSPPPSPSPFLFSHSEKNNEALCSLIRTIWMYRHKDVADEREKRIWWQRKWKKKRKSCLGIGASCKRRIRISNFIYWLKITGSWMKKRDKTLH